MTTNFSDDVFRFVALRPATLPDSEDTIGAPVRDERSFDDTLVGQVVAGMGTGLAQRNLLDLVAAAAEQANLEPTLPPGAQGRKLRAAIGVVEDHLRDFRADELASDLAAALDQPIADFVADDGFETSRDQLWDSLEAFYLLNRREPHNVEELVKGIRTLRLLALLEEAVDIKTASELQRVTSATLVLPQSLVKAGVPEREPSPREKARTEEDEKKKAAYRDLWRELIEVHEALTAVEHSVSDPVIEQQRVEAPDDPEVVRNVRDRAYAGELFYPSPGFRAEGTARSVIDRNVLRSLPEGARHLAESATATAALSEKPAVIAALESRLTELSGRVTTTGDPLLFEVMPAEARSLPGLKVLGLQFGFEPSLEIAGPVFEVSFPWVLKPVIRPLGIGDLKVVKEKLLRYMTGEVAHIENVLLGESKERKHRRLDRSEETFTVEIEQVDEAERDTQTTDRFELKKETEKTIQTDMSIDAGVTVSASYGPVELGAYANFAYSQSSTDTTRTSSNFARDVVDRSLTKIKKRAREERVTKTLREIEETNTHGLNNVGGAGHISGIYRWVDKEYEAQVYNYGKRMMFEFVIPEPASYYYYSQDNDPAKVIDIKKPQELGLLRHTDITDWNFGSYLRAYNVQGVNPPPPRWKVATMAFDQNGMTDNQAISKSTKELVVPDGYLAKTWGYRWHAWMGSDDYFRILVGLEVNGGSLTLDNEDTVVPISIVGHDLRAFAANVEVFCERTARTYETWQISTFEKIVTAYETAVALYEDKLKAAEAQRGIVITGRNPGLNRIIVRNELKKQALALFTGVDYATFDAITGNPPVMDLNEAFEEGKFIQFFEQAFEWEQMTYLFYPYFWARPTTWNKRINFNDVDPHFNNFLSAGSGRVVIPVHPAYNDAVLHYVETGAMWNGGEPPHIDDPLFISIVEELKAATDDLAGAVPEGEPWKVVVPTTLTYLQADSTLPDFTV
jgi:hypothetical protein